MPAGGRASRPVTATYRLQLEPGRLTFADAAGLVGYLSALGVSHLYCSPLLEAQPGSRHGYDVVDPTQIRGELGGEAGLRALAAEAHAAGLGLIADLVPNHMGVGEANPLWERLLSDGPEGRAARFFDVDWEPALPGAAGKVVLPVLGAPFGEVLHAGELELVDRDGLRLRYHEHAFPLSSESAATVRRAGGAGAFAGRPGDPASWDRLAGLIEAQHYRLVWWRAGVALVNYRRFFAIDELAALRVEDLDVFAHTHAKIIELVADGVVDGLRIDHPDGLRDPARYCERLAAATAGAWTVVEKITAPGEALPPWPVAGTTGYDFARDVLGLYVDPASRPALDGLAEAFGGRRPFAAVAAESKRAALDAELPADVDRLAARLWRLAQTDREARDVTLGHCREAIGRVAVALDVYRTYVDPETGTARPEDAARIEAAVTRAAGRLPDGSTAAAPAFLYRFLGGVLCGAAGASAAHLDLVARFQQLSAALEAKGVEDTALYRDVRLLAVNEVGGDPERLGLSAHEFHRRNAERARRHPLGLLTTATHDTKRGEDVRLRIAALTELGARWPAAAARWRDLNAGLVSGTPSGPAPDPATELLLYQTLVGVWPTDGEPGGELRRRVAAYAVKAAREAGTRTTHVSPDAAYERGLTSFVEGLLDEGRSRVFLDDLAGVARAVTPIAVVSGAAQALLRVTSPGVPDLYQGAELWDDALVDPDNRRPVDFARRRALLEGLEEAAPAELLARPGDGRWKLWVLWRSLGVRRALPAVFGAGSGYRPLAAEGAWADHVVAFARTAPEGQPAAITVAPRLPGRLTAGGRRPAVGEVWEDTVLVLPPGLQGAWTERCTGTRVAGERLALRELLGVLPVALLVREDAG